MNTIKVYNLQGSPLELPRESVILTQRSAMVQVCQRKRWLLYHGGPQAKGLDGALRPDDMELGSAVHKGLEILVGGQAPLSGDGSAGWVARNEFSGKFHEGKLLVAGDPWIQDVNPEMAWELVMEQAHLAQGLVEAFKRRHSERFLAEYEVASLEEEINWLLGVATDGRHIVVMSRPDGVVRGKLDGKLYVVSHKTAKRFYSDSIEKLSIDPQQITEGLAVQSRYGEIPGGTLYFYLLKGDRKKDENGYLRYESGLVRPWMDLRSLGGQVQPSHFAMVWKWDGSDGAKGGRLGPGWERVNVWEHLEFEQWIEWLDKGFVQPAQGRDWLAEAVAAPMVEVWDPQRAEEWAEANEWIEEDWNNKVEATAGEVKWFPKTNDTTSLCFKFTKPCQFYGLCHRGESLEAGLASGRWVPREANHPTERGQDE